MINANEQTTVSAINAKTTRLLINTADPSLLVEIDRSEFDTGSQHEAVSKHRELQRAEWIALLHPPRCGRRLLAPEQRGKKRQYKKYEHYLGNPAKYCASPQF